jgi:hypothetical protein
VHEQIHLFQSSLSNCSYVINVYWWSAVQMQWTDFKNIRSHWSCRWKTIELRLVVYWFCCRSMKRSNIDHHLSLYTHEIFSWLARGGDTHTHTSMLRWHVCKLADLYTRTRDHTRNYWILSRSAIYRSLLAVSAVCCCCFIFSYEQNRQQDLLVLTWCCTWSTRHRYNEQSMFNVQLFDRARSDND